MFEDLIGDITKECKTIEEVKPEAPVTETPMPDGSGVWANPVPDNVWKNEMPDTVWGTSDPSMVWGE